MTVHKKMAREERAKQFAAFAALKGYEEALQKKEEEILLTYGEETADSRAAKPGTQDRDPDGKNPEIFP